MTDREKLIELLCNLPTPEFVIGTRRAGKKLITAGFIADHLIANGVTVQEWISVKDRLPEEKVKCIVRYKHAYCDNDDYWAIGISFYDGEEFQIGLSYKVTHWQYLPQPPKGE